MEGGEERPTFNVELSTSKALVVGLVGLVGVVGLVSGEGWVAGFFIFW